jgi:hypothetical protein
VLLQYQVLCHTVSHLSVEDNVERVERLHCEREYLVGYKESLTSICSFIYMVIGMLQHLQSYVELFRTSLEVEEVPC